MYQMDAAIDADAEQQRQHDDVAEIERHVELYHEPARHHPRQYQRHEDQGLVIIGVHTKKGAEKMRAFVEEQEIPYPVCVDAAGTTVAAFGVDSYPDYYMIDRAGRLRVADLANDDLERAVGVLLAEKPPGQRGQGGEGAQNQGSASQDAAAHPHASS